MAQGCRLEDLYLGYDLCRMTSSTEGKKLYEPYAFIKGPQEKDN